jgi:hypothetical protein
MELASDQAFDKLVSGLDPTFQVQEYVHVYFVED